MPENQIHDFWNTFEMGDYDHLISMWNTHNEKDVSKESNTERHSRELENETNDD